jgi:two-component system response regulator FixJ
LSSSQIVHVIDDDADVRRSLVFLLSTAGLAVRVYESAVAFLNALPQAQDGCIVTDIRMPEMDGLELQRKLNAIKSTMPVIVITGHGDVALAVEAMKAGAIDFIEKPFDDEVLLSTIRSALARHESNRERGSKVAEIRGRLALLSEREQQVLDGLVAGKANKVIAYDLGISARTVEIYRANVMTKMQADSLSSLVRMVLLDSGSDEALR